MTSKFAITTACAWMLSTMAAFAGSDTGAVKETVRSFLAKANAGDSAGMAALWTQSASIIDEFAPFRWDALGDWGNAYDSYSKANSITSDKTTIAKFTHVNVDGGRAYVVATVVYSFKENGKHRSEPGTEVYSLEKADRGWRIASFAWFGKAGVDAGADANAITSAASQYMSDAAPPKPAAVAVVDEFAPYHWTGASAQADWAAGWQKVSATAGMRDISLHLEAPSQLSVNGDTGYGTFPTTINYTMHGKKDAEHGAFAFTFAKDAGVWHVTSWAWATR